MVLFLGSSISILWSFFFVQSSWEGQFYPLHFFYLKGSGFHMADFFCHYILWSQSYWFCGLWFFSLFTFSILYPGRHSGTTYSWVGAFNEDVRPISWEVKYLAFFVVKHEWSRMFIYGAKVITHLGTLLVGDSWMNKAKKSAMNHAWPVMCNWNFLWTTISRAPKRNHERNRIPCQMNDSDRYSCYFGVIVLYN